jgi:hypothetical protein
MGPRISPAKATRRALPHLQAYVEPAVRIHRETGAVFCPKGYASLLPIERFTAWHATQVEQSLKTVDTALLRILRIHDQVRQVH